MFNRPRNSGSHSSFWNRRSVWVSGDSTLMTPIAESKRETRPSWVARVGRFVGVILLVPSLPLGLLVIMTPKGLGTLTPVIGGFLILGVLALAMSRQFDKRIGDGPTSTLSKIARWIFLSIGALFGLAVLGGMGIFILFIVHISRHGY